MFFHVDIQLLLKGSSRMKSDASNRVKDGFTHRTSTGLHKRLNRGSVEAVPSRVDHNRHVYSDGTR